MQLHDISSAFNAAAALQKCKLLPVKREVNAYPLLCSNCCFINRKDYNFCTNCGYPVHPHKDKLFAYYSRVKKRERFQRQCIVKVEHARNALYVLAAFSMLGIFYVFSNIKQKAITGMVMVLLGFIYAALGRWSLQKPVTALLISLIIMLSFAAINTWAEISSMFTTASGVYLLMVQIILIYFLLQGVKGAFHADILKDEFKL
ncbi:MAG: hypothetical protein M3040_12850 [Bacteroidota bacterium]|nr:hypothetical protein [Bacteroidota bacterium]